MNNILKIENFYKSYNGKTWAVEDLNLSIDEGQIVAFIGHNGAGKTTTLKAVASIMDFDKGNIEVLGKNVKTHSHDSKALIAYLPDNPDLYEHLKGIDFINFVADAYQVLPETRKSLVEKYAKLFKIEENLAQSISTYSHGMKQKLAIISALVHSPKLLLLDEPFVGLDPQSSHDFKLIMQQLVKDGCAILYSTHVLEVAEKLATHVAIIHKGKIIKYGGINETKGNESLEKLFLELASND